MKVVCALLGLLLLGAPAAEAGAKRKPCAPRAGERVVVKSKRAVVTEKGRSFTGCRYSTGRRHALVELGDIIEDASHFVLAGDKLAFAYTTGNNNGIRHTAIRVIDTRRWRQARWADGPNNEASNESARVERLALSPRGWVAWRSRYDRGEPGRTIAKQMIDIDEGDGTYRLYSAEAGSLGGPRFASRSRVVWTHDGVELSARVAAASGRPCTLRYGERVEVASRRVLVTRIGDTWYGCRRSSGRRAVLAEDSDDPDERRRASRFTIAGDYIAFLDERFGRYAVKGVDIEVRDSRRWRHSTRVPVGSTRGEFELETLTVEELALSPLGWVAWRARYEDYNPERRVQEESISLHDGGGTRVLDRGPITSLAGPRFTTPTRVLWTHDGAERSAEAQAAPPST